MLLDIGLEPNLTGIFNAIIGPWGAVFVLCLAIYFLWKLFREEQEENRRNFGTVATLSDAVKAGTNEIHELRSVIETLRGMLGHKT
jgi:hypothetical protein